MQLYFTEMNSRYFKHCNGIFVNNYLLTGNKMQLYFTEMNSRYFICKKITLDFISCSKSLILIWKRRGPKTEPWSTPKFNWKNMRGI